MAQGEDKHNLEAKFAAAVKVIQSLPEDGENLFQFLSTIVFEWTGLDLDVYLSLC